MRFSFFLLLSALLMLNGNSHAQSCTVIAKVQAAENLNDVFVMRNMRQQALKSLNAELCAGDVLIVPESLAAPVTINYYSENLEQQQFTAGQHEITALETPCSNWCKLTKTTKRLYIKLTRQNINPPQRITATDRGDSEDLPTSTLLERKPPPLYLFADNPEVDFFWKGGKEPYQLIVKDQQGKVVVNQRKLYDKHTQFSLPDANSNQTYQLILQDKRKKQIETDIILRLPPFPLNPEENKLLRLTRLLLDNERNWRLEVWRQLRALPENPKVHKFKAHVIVNDF